MQITDEMLHRAFDALRNQPGACAIPTKKALHDALTAALAVPGAGSVAWADESMAMHWIDRYAAGIDDEPQMNRILACVAAPAAMAGTAEPVAWLAEGPGWKRVFIDREAAEKLAKQGGRLTPTYAAPAASVPDGLSAWEGWDRSRGDWSESKHKDDVLEALFRAPWSIEDAAAMIGFIDRTWHRRPTLSSHDKEGGR